MAAARWKLSMTERIENRSSRARRDTFRARAQRTSRRATGFWTAIAILIGSAALPDAAFAAAPAGPSGLSATPISPTRIDLKWSDHSDNEAVFVVERRAAGTTEWTVAWEQNNASFPSLSDMGLPAGGRFEYRVKARAKDGAESPPSSIAAATTPAGPAAFNNLLQDRRAWTSSFQWRKVPPYQAVDGTQWTRWWSKLSPENAPRVDWLCVDMGARRTIDKIRIIWQRDWWARKYEIQISDDAVTFTTMLAVENATFQPIEERRFPAATGRYVRFLGLESANQQKTWGGYGSYSIYEFQAYAPGVEPDPLEWESAARGRAVTASTRPELARGAVDGHLGTFWSARHGRESTITVDLGAEFDVYGIQPVWHVPVDAYQLRVSSDGEMWRTVADQSSMDVMPVENEEVREIHSVSFSPAQRARHVRVVIIGRVISPDPNFAQVILQELLVHGAPIGASRAK